MVISNNAYLQKLLIAVILHQLITHPHRGCCDNTTYAGKANNNPLDNGGRSLSHPSDPAFANKTSLCYFITTRVDSSAR